jgi:hypothetical protein
MIVNKPTPSPVFTKGQQLKSTSLNGIVEFARDEIQDTRMLLEGCGIFYGLEAKVDKDAGTIRLTPGTAVTSDGKIFSLDTEIVYDGFKDTQITLLKKSVNAKVLSSINENHDAFIHHLGGVVPDGPVLDPDPLAYVIVLFVTSTETKEGNCLYGQESSESKVSLEIKAALIDRAFFESALDAWFINDTSEAGDKDPVINRFGYVSDDAAPYISFERFTDWAAVSDGFDEVCATAEPLLGDACKLLYDLVKEKLGLPLSPNPFADLAQKLGGLRERIMENGGRAFPWLYDYYRDLVATYQEFVSTDLFSYLSLFPKKDRFPDYIALGSIRTKVSGKDVYYRMGLYRPPFTDLSINALERPSLLMERLQYLASVAHTRFDETNFPAFGVHITPDAGINKPLSERAIPFYYNDAGELSACWNADLKRNQRMFTIPGVSDERDRKFLLANMDGYNFFRIKGHTGEAIEATRAAVEVLRSELHLPFDLRFVYLGEEEDIMELILEETVAFSDLTILLEKVVNDIRCARTCSDKFEESLFGERFDRNRIGDMFEALLVLFGPLPADLDKKLEELCSRENACYDQDKTCCKAHLTSLYAICVEYARRKNELADSLLFHRFAKRHPGLEHNGGVPKGGTLVLVCGKTDPSFLSAEKKEDLVKLMLSGKAEDVAAGRDLAAVLANYKVVADFCLPYICCSDAPALNLIFVGASPVARFTVASQEPLPEGVGVALELKNESLRADSYHWELRDYTGAVLNVQDTTDLEAPGVFELLVENGVVFTVVLTAAREDKSSEYSSEFTICPQGNVSVTSDGKDSVDWDITQRNEIAIEAAPYGGSFDLILQQNDNEEQIDRSGYDVTWNEDKKNATLTVYEPQAGTYRLRYTFEEVEDCKESSAVLVLNTFIPDEEEPTPEPTDTDTDTDPVIERGITPNTDAAFNKRMLSYRGGINAMSKEDEALAEDSRWSDTKTFLLASGTPEELHAGYEKLQTVLQAGFTKLKARQKAQVIKLLIYATAYYIDRLIAATPEKVPSIARKLVKAAAVTISTQKDGIAQWQEVWGPYGIETPENEKTVAVYKALIG